MTTKENWQGAARSYLDRLGLAEYQAQRAAAKKRKFRYCPTQYHRDLVYLLGKNDEEGFKARKMLEGYGSKLGF